MANTEKNIIWSSNESEPDPSSDEQVIIETNDDDYDTGTYSSDIKYDRFFYPSIKDFTGSFQDHDSVKCCNLPLDYFELFFDHSLFEIIKSQTNLYQEQNPESYHLNMKAWGLGTSDDPLLSTPIFNTVMCRNRYLQILRFLHFAYNDELGNHPLKKVKPVIDDLRVKFASTISPGKCLCIDESLVLWKGRLMFKQYLPFRRNRFGIKVFELVDCKSGFLIDFIVYTGSTTDFKKCGLGISGDIIAHFLEPYFHKGHVIYIDNWYSSSQLAEFLHDKDTGMCGTLLKNRKSLPKLKAKLNKGHVEVAHNDAWLILKWSDKKEVYMITTVHKLGFSCTVIKDWKTGENIIKPTCIVEYNQNMGAVDNIDRQLSLTETTRNSMKWYRNFFFHLVDLSLANAHALYNQRADIPLSFPKFRLEEVRNMLGIDSNRHSSSIQSSNLRLTGRHFAVPITSEDSSKFLQHLNATYVFKHSALHHASMYITQNCIYHNNEIHKKIK
ncbi:piggyBac transposable element-derived protein 4-like [Prorops nasuta]|uniref:piggyBac transposable element-derived protein 4-like n=1 Tax=Prorops nasuta TaxID=863751 RepID=UPI0034CD3686